MSLEKAVDSIEKFARDLPPAINHQLEMMQQHHNVIKAMPDHPHKGALLESFSKIAAANSMVIEVLRSLSSEK